MWHGADSAPENFGAGSLPQLPRHFCAVPKMDNIICENIYQWLADDLMSKLLCCPTGLIKNQTKPRRKEYAVCVLGLYYQETVRLMGSRKQCSNHALLRLLLAPISIGGGACLCGGYRIFLIFPYIRNMPVVRDSESQASDSIPTYSTY